MKTIKYRFYDARQAGLDGKPMTAVDRLIMLRSDLTHEDKQFDENRGYVSCSSTMADGANGVRFKYIKYSHPKRWRTLAVQVSDAEEQILWESCCKDADLDKNWQYAPFSSCTLSVRITDGFFAESKDVTIYQGPNHVKYDILGLMTFALEKSPSVWRNIQRWAIWAWTVVITPDPRKMWCSEFCCKKFNVMNLLIGQIQNTNIDPQKSYEIKRKMHGIREI